MANEPDGGWKNLRDTVSGARARPCRRSPTGRRTSLSSDAEALAQRAVAALGGNQQPGGDRAPVGEPRRDPAGLLSTVLMRARGRGGSTVRRPPPVQRLQHEAIFHHVEGRRRRRLRRNGERRARPACPSGVPPETTISCAPFTSAGRRPQTQLLESIRRTSGAKGRRLSNPALLPLPGGATDDRHREAGPAQSPALAPGPAKLPRSERRHREPCIRHGAGCTPARRSVQPPAAPTRALLKFSQSGRPAYDLCSTHLGSRKLRSGS